jgi:hypothetical protein
MTHRSAPLLIALLFAASPAFALAQNADQKSVEWEDAAKTPFRDVNVIRQKIPAVLRQAEDNAYRAPRPATCQAIAGEVRGLTAVLGEDFDVPPDPTPPTKEEKRTGTTNKVLKGAAGSIVPFRGWVRQLSGAEQHAQAVQTAVAAGRVRRAYLKGMGQMMRCQPPAAPLRVAAKPKG